MVNVFHFVGVKQHQLIDTFIKDGVEVSKWKKKTKKPYILQYFSNASILDVSL